VIPILRVKSPGLHTTVQDLGRDGFADVGVPPSGALDAVALRLANALVGNAPNAAALEILVSGPALEAIAESVHVAFVGGTAGVSVQDAHQRSVAPGRSVHLKQGDVIVQQATNHAWVNRGKEPCRILVVLMGSRNP